MAIESLEKAIKNEELPVQNHGVVTNNVVLAGLSLRHKLLPNKYLLEGFIVEDNNYHSEGFGFKIKLNKIQYNEFNANCNETIYRKIVVDGKKSNFSEFFESADRFRFRNENGKRDYLKGNTFFTNEFHTPWNGEPKFEYYLYEQTTSHFPECAANKIFALCKYYEEGEFKYCIFNLHEIAPEDSCY